MTEENKLNSVDGYTVVDVPAATRLVGPVRCARKVLPRTTIDLVRHVTYTCAVHQLDASGAAAALNHDRASDDQSPIAAFANELATWAQTRNFTGSTGIGIGNDEAGSTLPVSTEAAAAATIAAAVASVPGGAETIVIVSDAEEEALVSALGDASTSIEADLATALASGADAVLVRGTTGDLNHDVVAQANAKTIIGLQPLTTTARGLAVAGRAGAIIVPDFISAAGPVLAALGHRAEHIGEMTSSVMDALRGHGVDLYVAACERAETHLQTLTNELPFGRPLAP